MPKLVFLDFDGVLHPTSATPDQHFCRIPLLAEALADTEGGLVISSSWRHHYDFAALQLMFPPSLRSRIVGTTGEPRHGRWPRHQEILAYVRQAGCGASWRALDDSWNEFPACCRELIACNPNAGIDVGQASALRDWLRRG